MSRKAITPLWEEVTFEEEGLDARALVTRTDKNGIITFASKAYRDMTKYSKNEIVGFSHSIVRHPFMPKAAFKEMWDTIKQGKHWNGLVMNLRKDGKHYWVEVRIDAIDSDGNIISSMASVGKNDFSGYNYENISGYVAIRREPTRSEIREAMKYYKSLKKEELNNKLYLKEWEKELLKNL
jgi:aerotaxis receptor